MREIFIFTKGVLVLGALVALAGVTAGVTYGIIEQAFIFGRGLIT